MRAICLVWVGLFIACDDGASPQSPDSPTPDAAVIDAAPVDAAAEDACADCRDARVLRTVDFGPSDRPDGGPDGPLRPIDEGCSDLFAQDILPVYYLEMDPVEWAAIEDEFANWQQRENEGLPIKPYHPIRTFRYEDEIIDDAQIRLKANQRFSWRPPKMQFVINFRKVDRTKRFHGQRKLNLDAPWYDPTLIRERVATAFLREAGLAAPCANNAVLVVNGEMYGLYTNKEHIDKEFLERNFEDPEGDLWKYGFEIRTNDETATPERRDALWATRTPEEFAQHIDREQVLRAWAGEAMLPHHDGYWCCNHNYYIYDEPGVGFKWVLHDMDITFQGFNMTDPRFDLFRSGGRRAEHFAMTMADPQWRQDFARVVAELTPFYDPVEFRKRVDFFAQQTAMAYAADPNLPFERSERGPALQKMLDFFVPRRAYLESFATDALACERGEAGEDRDRDGVGRCTDCDDLNRQVQPGAPDVCNDRDDDCDGRTDEDQPCADCVPVEGDGNYVLCDAPQAWFDGHATCARQGGALAIPVSLDDRRLLGAAAGALSDDPWWIGANDGGQEDRWTDRNGQVIDPLPWAEGQPNGGDDQNCATLDPTRLGDWADETCISALPVICQLP